MKLRALLFLTLALAVSACSILGDDDGGDTVDARQQSLEVIQWPQQPDHIIFQADIVGGENFDSFIRQGEAPLCTLYGDGRVVWRVNNGGVNDQILFDIVEPQIIRIFVNELTVVYNIYNQTAAADLMMNAESPVVETLTIEVNDRKHITDAFGGWDYDYFEEIEQQCEMLADTPTVFQPTGAWLSAQETPYDNTSPTQGWDPEVSGLDLGELAADGDPIWIEGQLLRIMWDLTQRNPPDIQLTQGAENYHIVLQIPNITRSSPPAP